MPARPVQLRLGALALLWLLHASSAWAAPATKTYDFNGISSPSSTHQGFYDASSSFTTTVLAPTGEDGELTTTAYGQIEADDSTNTGALIQSNKLRHFRFRFVVAESPASMTAIRPYWIGSDEGGTTQTFYIWNFSAGQWESRGTSTATTDTAIDGGAITANFANYVNASGHLFLAAVADSPTGNKQFRTDYVRVTIDYEAATTAPDAPASLNQYRADGTTAIPVGDTTTDRTIVFKGSVSDPDGDSVQLAVEVEKIGVAFDGVATGVGSAVASGSTASVSINLPNASYHWQAWAIDSHGAAGTKVSFGANAESATDVVVDALPVTYYVKKTGTDTCSLARENDATNSFLTIQAAFNCLKTNQGSDLTGKGPFRIEILDGGTYAELVTLTGLTTTASDTFTLRSSPGLAVKPLIDGGGARRAGVVVESMNFAVIDGLRFTNFGGGTGTTDSYYAGVSINNANDVEVRNSVMFATADFGLTIGYNSDARGGARADRAWIHHNVFYDIRAGGTDPNNRGDCIHIMSGSSAWKIENNTFYDCDQSAIFTMGDAAPETDGIIRNNVMVSTSTGTKLLKIGDATEGGQTGLVSDHNTVFRVGGAGVTGLWGTMDQTALADWQGASGKDANSSETDPLFVNAGGGDFHLLSSGGYRKNGDAAWYTDTTACSPSVDQGAPGQGYAMEPIRNGGRLNRGAYGNTAEASKTCACMEPLGDGTDLNDGRTASRVCPIVRNETISGVQNSGSDVTDWFFFNVTHATSYTFTLNITSIAQFDLYLYDGAGTLIASDAPGSLGTVGPLLAARTVAATLAPGVHYVEVRYISGTSSYDLAAAYSDPLSAAVHSFAALPSPEGVQVTWEVEPESEAIGFRLLRHGGYLTTIGADPLVVDAAALPATFFQTDHEARCGDPYEYELEELRADGSVIVHGPVAVPACAGDGGRGCRVSLSPSGPGGILASLACALLATGFGLVRRRSRFTAGTRG